jgi:glycosyltransferase involved in cell wall biosynthesis
VTAPQVSVALPTRNRWAMLEQALGSALGQRGVEVEVIVVDEASSDETPERLQRIDDDRVSFVRHDTPKGPAAARNTAIERARGEWIAFLDDDDLWSPEKLHTQLSRALANGHQWSYTGRIEVDHRMAVIHAFHPPDPGDLTTRLLSNNTIGGPSSVVLRKDLLDRIGAFDERLPPLEDWDLWIRAAALGSAQSCPEPLIAYRFHPENLMITAADRITKSFELLSAKHRGAAADAGFEFGAVWLARWIAARDLAAGRRLPAARAYLRCASLERSPRDIVRAVGALAGGRLEALGRSMEARMNSRPDWLERYA